MARPRARGARRFVGRGREFRELSELLDKVSAGGSVAAAVVGDPGIGKTRLLRELATRAEAAGFQVLSGFGSEFEQEVPFGLAVDSFDERFATLTPDILDRLGDERVAELAAVFPSVASTGRRLSGTLEIERFRFHSAVHAALEETTRRRPGLLVLDDLHWADPASMELVSHLLRRRVRSAMLVAAYRPTPPSARKLFDRVECAHVLELGPLSATDLAACIGEHPDSARARALYDESGGNPFYFTELANTSTTHDLVCAPRADDGTVPATVRAAIDRELDALSPSARQLAQAGAVSGEPFEVSFAAVVAQLPDSEALIALDELVTSHIIASTDIPGRFVFRHPIVRRAVYDATGPGWRLGAHQRAADELTARAAPVTTRAHHVERSARQGDDTAIALLANAGHTTATRAPAAAARWFSAAVRLTPPTTPPARRLELLLPLAAAHAATGRSQESRTTLEQARAIVAPDDLATHRRVTTLLAAAEQALGNGTRARELLTQALDHTEQNSTQAAAITIELAMNHTMLGEWDAAVQAAAKAACIARQHQDRALIASATVARAIALLNAGDSELEAARQCTAQASEIFASLPDDELSHSHLSTLASLAVVQAWSRQFTTAQRHAERCLRLCRESGRGDAVIPCTLVLSAATTMKGDLAEAAPLADAAVEAATLMDNDQWLAPAEGIRCLLYTQQGQLTKALAAGRNAVQAAERAPQSIFWWVACSFYAVALIEAGEHERGRRELYRAVGPTLSKIPPTHRPYWRNVLVGSYLATGELSAAHELVELMERHESELGRGELLHSTEARRARASVLFALGRHSAAAQVALQAAGRYEVNEMYVDAARARLLAGRALVAGGAPADGERELTRAHDALSRRGASRLADQAAKELRALGKRVSPRSKPRGTTTGITSLSDREREIADQVASGKTNRQIATEFFLSPKTIEAHLARIYTKLNVSSRTAMVATLASERER